MVKSSWLQTELTRAKEQGLTVHIGGNVCAYDNPEALSCLLEDPGYMIDYVSDEEGKITGICFDKINDQYFPS